VAIAPAGWRPADNELSGKTILVTGANDGIGRAVAIACARVGAEVLLLGRDEAALETVYDAIVAERLPTPGLIPFDLRQTSIDAYDALANALSEDGIKLDGLLHNASVLGERRALAQTSLESWQEVMQINITAIFLMTRSLMPLLEAAPSSSVVLTSSGVGRRGKAYWGPYAVSKFATEGFMEVLADELAATSRIRVNSLNPGAVNTKMRRAAYPGESPDSNPLPEALVNQWIFLLGDASEGINGEALSAQ